MTMRPYTLRLDPTGTEGGAGGSTGDHDAAAKALSGLLAKHANDANAVALMLLTENRDYRARNAELKAKLPPDGHTTLPASEVDALTEYRKLGKPDELSAALAERAKATAELDSLRKAETVREAASLVGYKPGVLATLVRAEGLDLAITTDAKGVRSVTVKDGDKDVPLADLVSSKWSDLLPALKAEKTAQGTPSRDTTRATPEPTGVADKDRTIGALMASGRYVRL
jgi:hypothetical protein